MSEIQSYSAFEGHKLLAQGPLEKVVLRVKKKIKDDHAARVLVFSDSTGKQMDFDLSGSESDVLGRLKVYVSADEAAPSTGPGRPKLGVVSREVSLLPRHWEWLSTQSGGASATLRRLVDDARKTTSGRDGIKQAQERAYKFMAALAGDLPHYEEVLRALYRKDKKTFETQMAAWPRDVREHTTRLAKGVFA